MAFGADASALAATLAANMGDDMQLSQNPGEGAGSMSSFVQRAMMNIMAPMVKRIEDLEDTAAYHAYELKDAHDKVESATQRLGHHDRNIGTLEGDMIRTKTELQRAHELICEGSERHASLESDHDATRATTNRLDAGHKSMSSLLADQQRLHEDLDGRCRQLQLMLSETNIAHLNINDKLQEVKNRLEGFSDRHAELVKSAQELKQADEASKAALKRINSQVEKHRRDAERTFLQIDDRSKNMELAVVEVQGIEEKAAKAIKAIRQDVDRNRIIIDQLMGEDGKLGSMSATSGPKPSDVQGRVNKMEEMVGKLAGALSSDKSGMLHHFQQLRDTVALTSATAAKNASDYEHLDKAIKSQDHRLYKVEQRCGLMEGRADKLKDQVERQDADFRNQLGNTQASLQSKLDTHAHEQAKTNERINQGSSRVDCLQNSLDNMKLELAGTNSAVGRLGQSLDLAHEYVQGMSKGLNDTPKRVHGDGVPSPPIGRPMSARGPRPGAGSSTAGYAGYGSGLPTIR